MSIALSLSDEEFSKLPVPELEAVPDTEEKEEPEQEEEPQEVSTEAQEPSKDEEATQVPAEEENAAEEPAGALAKDTEEVSEEKSTSVDYKAAYEEIFKPFKANGKEMSVDNIDDVRQLMQMGANYNKKMAALKPNLKIIKMLENNGLLDESKLSYLIDIEKRNPEAIKKLIKDSGLDPLDIDINSDIVYKANTYTVNDKEVELDAVLSEIKETDSFNTTIDIIGNKWDDRSKQVLLDNPGVIKIINEHVSNGVYKTISTEVEKLRMLGRLEGLSDIDAYKAVGDALYAPRANAGNGNQVNTSTNKATNTDDPKLKDRKKAAAPVKSAAHTTKPDFNPLSLSDDEFEKIASSKFI